MDKPDTVCFLVLYWSYGFSMQTATQLWQHVPEAFILAIVNEPLRNDFPERAASYNTPLAKRYRWGKGNVQLKWTEAWTRRFCEAEADWFRKQKQCLVVSTPRFMLHGEAINLAFQWSRERGIKRLMHIEPDCIISGRSWYDSLHRAWGQDVWLVARPTNPESLTPSLTPSLWSVKDATKLDFSIQWEQPECTEERHRPYFEKANRLGYWDTGTWAIYQAMARDKAKTADCSDFTHLFRGTSTIYENSLLFL